MNKWNLPTSNRASNIPKLTSQSEKKNGFTAAPIYYELYYVLYSIVCTM